MTPRAPLPRLLLALALAGAACVAPAERGRDEDARFEHAFGQLARAVDAGDDAVARRILAGILARGPSGRAAEVAQGFEAILDGRRLAEELAFELVADPLPDGEGAYALALRCTGTPYDDVTLRLPPMTVERLATWVTPGGSEARSIEALTVEEVHRLRVPAGGEVRLELGVFRPELDGALAQRDRWRAETRSGEVLVGERPLPVRAPDVRSLELVHLAPFLPREPVDPQALLDYVRRESVAMPPLMERAVRIPPERWNETLRRLRPVAAELSDERLSEIAPALRWLSRTARVGGDPRAWRLILAAGFREEPGVPGLDLPEPGEEGPSR